MTGSGAGHSHGQYAEESARRSRWPAGIAWAMPSSSKRDVNRSPGTSGEGSSWLFPVGQVEHAARDQQRGAVGRHVAEPRGELRHRPVAVQRRARTRTFPSSSIRSVQRVRVEAERPPVVCALVERALRRGFLAAPDTPVDPAQEVGAGLEPAVSRRRAPRAGSRVTERTAAAARRRAPATPPRPPIDRAAPSRAGRGAPPPGSKPKRRLVHDAGVLVLQPLIPPADALLQEADGGTRG